MPNTQLHSAISPAAERHLAAPSLAAPWSERMLSVLRIVAGLVFFSAGTTIVFGYPPPPAPGVPPFDPFTQMGFGGLLEMIGGFAIALGLFTRPVAFVLSGEMAVAYFQFHLPQSLFPTVNGGMPAVLFSFLFLYFVFTGGGAWSVDALIARGSVTRARAEDAGSTRPIAPRRAA